MWLLACTWNFNFCEAAVLIVGALAKIILCLLLLSVECTLKKLFVHLYTKLLLSTTMRRRDPTWLTHTHGEVSYYWALVSSSRWIPLVFILYFFCTSTTSRLVSRHQLFIRQAPAADWVTINHWTDLIFPGEITLFLQWNFFFPQKPPHTRQFLMQVIDRLQHWIIHSALSRYGHIGKNNQKEKKSKLKNKFKLKVIRSFAVDSRQGQIGILSVELIVWARKFLSAFDKISKVNFQS